MADMDYQIDPDGRRRLTTQAQPMPTFNPAQTSDPAVDFMRMLAERRMKAYDEDREFELSQRREALAQNRPNPNALGAAGSRGPVNPPPPAAETTAERDARQMRQLALRDAMRESDYAARLRQMDLNPPKTYKQIGIGGAYLVDDTQNMPMSMRPTTRLDNAPKDDRSAESLYWANVRRGMQSQPSMSVQGDGSERFKDWLTTRPSTRVR